MLDPPGLGSLHLPALGLPHAQERLPLPQHKVQRAQAAVAVRTASSCPLRAHGSTRSYT